MFEFMNGMGGMHSGEPVDSKLYDVLQVASDADPDAIKQVSFLL